MGPKLYYDINLSHNMKPQAFLGPQAFWGPDNECKFWFGA